MQMTKHLYGQEEIFKNNFGAYAGSIYRNECKCIT